MEVVLVLSGVERALRVLRRKGTSLRCAFEYRGKEWVEAFDAQGTEQSALRYAPSAPFARLTHIDRGRLSQEAAGRGYTSEIGFW